MKMPKRYKTGVGKFIGGRVYFHKNYVNRFIDDPIFIKGYKLLLEKAQEIGFDYTIISYDIKTGHITFTHSPDWDTAPEPLVGNRIVYVPTPSMPNIKAFNTTRANIEESGEKNPFIYHHKWLFVGEDYKGFDIAKSMLRSIAWMKLNPDCSRIGRKNYWYTEVVPKIQESIMESKLHNFGVRGGISE